MISHVESLAPSLSVLVVDDDREAADSLALLLRFWGHQVQVAHTRVAGLRAAQEDPPDLIFLDLGLAARNGYKVARRLRRQTDRAPLLVALTGFGSQAERDRARSAGFDRCFAKPTDPWELKHLLKDHSEALACPL